MSSGPRLAPLYTPTMPPVAHQAIGPPLLLAPVALALDSVSIRTLGQGLIKPQPCSRVLIHRGWFLEGTRRSPVNGGKAAGFGVRGNVHPFSKPHTAQLSLAKLAADRGSLLPHGGVVTQGITVGRGAFQQPS